MQIQRILFVSNFSAVQEDPWLGAWSRYLPQLHSTEVTYRFLINSSKQSYAHRIGISPDLLSIIATSILEHFQRDGMSAGHFLHRHLDDQHLFIPLLPVVDTALQGYNPDIVISQAPQPWLRILLPNSLHLHTDNGIFSRPPFPEMRFYDPLGFVDHSLLSRYSDEVKSFVPTDHERHALANIRNAFKAKLSSLEWMPLILDNLRARYSKILLLPLQTPLLYQHTTQTNNYTSEYDICLNLGSNTSKDVCILALGRTDIRSLSQSEEADLRKRFPGMLFHSDLSEYSPSFANTANQSQFLLPFVDGLYSNSSSLNMQALFWNIPVICDPASFWVPFSEGSNIQEALEKNTFLQRSETWDNMAAWLLFRYCHTHKYLIRNTHFVDLMRKLSQVGKSPDTLRQYYFGDAGYNAEHVSLLEITAGVLPKHGSTLHTYNASAYYPEEIRQEFYSLDDFRLFTDTVPVFDERYREIMIDAVRADGVTNPLTGHTTPPDEIIISSKNYRDTVTAEGITSRMRAMLSELANLVGKSSKSQIRILGTEAFSPFALLLRSLFPRYYGFEYATFPEGFLDTFPIPISTLQRLNLPEACFDIIVTNDIMEHIPEISVEVAEMYRVLKPGGHIFATMPFRTMKEETFIRAEMQDGSPRYLTDAELHPNPLNPKGSLVFRLPGWDILQTFRKAGFSSSSIIFLISRKHGIVGGDIAGVMILRAQR